MDTPNNPAPIDARITRLNELAESHPVFARLRNWLSYGCNPTPLSPVGQGIIELLALVKTLDFNAARNLVREEIKVRGGSPKEIAERIANRLRDKVAAEQSPSSVTRTRSQFKVNFNADAFSHKPHRRRK
jgi:hypothetical protein